jgi:hypothetical protein
LIELVLNLGSLLLLEEATDTILLVQDLEDFACGVTLPIDGPKFLDQILKEFVKVLFVVNY